MSNIKIKTPKEIRVMGEGAKILAGIIKEIEKRVEPGITTIELDRLAEGLIFKHRGKPSFKNYHGFPATLCTSVNEEIVHGVPSQRVLKSGDIISLDIGIFLNGFHNDMAITLPVGEVDLEVYRLIKVTKKALKRGIKNAKIGNTFSDIGNSIQRYVESQGFNVIRDLCGHGIGRDLHEKPQILNYGKRGKGEKIKEGMVFCLEPMVTMGGYKIKKAKDGHAFVPIDNALSAHFEHMITATKNGPKILTRD